MAMLCVMEERSTCLVVIVNLSFLKCHKKLLHLKLRKQKLLKDKVSLINLITYEIETEFHKIYYCDVDRSIIK